MPETLPVGPAPPTPRRLNNLALIILSLAGAVLLATVVYFVSQRPATPPRVAAPPPRPEAETVEPGFLHRPPRTPYAPPVPSPPPPPIQSPGGDAAGLAELAALDALARGQQPPGSPPGSTELAPGAPSSGAPGGSFSTHYPYSTGSGAYSSAPATPPSDPRRDAYQRALRAPISISSPSTSGAAPAAGAPAGFSGLSLSTLPALRIPGLTEPLPEQREAAPPPQQDPTTAFLTSSRAPRDPRLAVTVDPPLSSTQLDAGSLIPAVLVTGINSDLPGDLVAQVSRDVFDSRAQRRVLIPRGSRLLGRYQNQIAAGQNRLLVAWDRLIFPDGASLRFPGLPGISLSGEAGLPGSVDNHLRSVFGSAVLLSLLGAGVQLSQPQQSATLGQAVSPAQVSAAALGQELSTVATEILRRRIAIAPTLRIPSGTEFEVLVHADLPLAAYR